MRPRSSKAPKPKLVDAWWTRNPRFERVYGACCPDSPISQLEQAVGVLRMIGERVPTKAAR